MSQQQENKLKIIEEDKMFLEKIEKQNKEIDQWFKKRYSPAEDGDDQDEREKK